MISFKIKLSLSDGYYIDVKNTSNFTRVPDNTDWRSVTLQTAPFAERIQTVRGPCCEKAVIFDAISCK